MKNLKLMFGLISISLLCACGGETPVFEAPDLFDETWETYTLPEGKNYANELAKNITWKLNTVEFEVRFSDECKYATVDTLNQPDINKLYGFTDCDTDIHGYSARFGWNYDEAQVGGGVDMINLFAYRYINGERYTEYLQSVNIGLSTTTTLKIQSDATSYIFSIGGSEVLTLDRGCSDLNKSKITARPYFGGDEPAPHDMTIQIKVHDNSFRDLD